jgi:hypothetical protein
LAHGPAPFGRIRAPLDDRPAPFCQIGAIFADRPALLCQQPALFERPSLPKVHQLGTH